MPYFGSQPSPSLATTGDIATNAIDGTLTKDNIIADYSDVTVTAADLIMYGDATDSNNTKRDTVQGVLDLAGGGGLIEAPGVFTSNGTYSKNTDASRIVVQVIGGGGGGGGANGGGNYSAGGGGGGGGYSCKTIENGSVGGTEAVTIGAGGAAASGNATGTTGGTSSFGSHATATGGVGGQGVSQNMSPGGAGGLGASGDINFYGDAGNVGSGTTAGIEGIIGIGGGTHLGGCTVAPTKDNAAKTDGAANSGAGGTGTFDGSSTNRTGGAGGSGIVIVWEYA